MFYSLSYDKDFREPVWRERSLLLGSCIYVSNSSLTAFMIPSISITLDEGSDTFILAKHKEVVRSARALSHVLLPRFLDGERIYSTIFSTSTSVF